MDKRVLFSWHDLLFDTSAIPSLFKRLEVLPRHARSSAVSAVSAISAASA